MLFTRTFEYYYYQIVDFYLFEKCEDVKKPKYTNYAKLYKISKQYSVTIFNRQNDVLFTIIFAKLWIGVDIHNVIITHDKKKKIQKLQFLKNFIQKYRYKICYVLHDSGIHNY